jgi:hypothetical protein
VDLSGIARVDGDRFVLGGSTYPAADAARVLYERWFVRGGSVGPALAASDRASARDLARSLAAVRAPVDGPDGWFHARGTALGRTDDVARVYLHVARGGARALVAALARLDHAPGVPFRFKVATEPAALARVDCAVLYVPRGRAPAALARLHRDAAPWLRDGTPPWTRALARGVAWADDPGGGVSFGLHRCGLAVDGLRAGIGVDAAFRAAGLDPTQPHLRAGARDLAFPALRDAPLPAWGPPA